MASFKPMASCPWLMSRLQSPFTVRPRPLTSRARASLPHPTSLVSPTISAVAIPLQHCRHHRSLALRRHNIALLSPALRTGGSKRCATVRCSCTIQPVGPLSSIADEEGEETVRRAPCLRWATYIVLLLRLSMFFPENHPIIHNFRYILINET